MDNDRIFAIYASVLVLGVVSAISAALIGGIATLPEAGSFLEHLALGVGFRGAYKSIGGFGWAREFGEFIGVITPEDVRVLPTTGAEMMGSA